MTYSLALNHQNEVALKNGRKYYVSSKEGYAVWFNSHDWLIGKVPELDKNPGDEDGCITSTTSPQNGRNSCLEFRKGGTKLLRFLTKLQV